MGESGTLWTVETEDVSREGSDGGRDRTFLLRAARSPDVGTVLSVCGGTS